MSLIRDGLALVGAYVVVRGGYRLYCNHIQQPLERFLTDVFDDETRRRQAAPVAQPGPLD